MFRSNQDIEQSNSVSCRMWESLTKPVPHSDDRRATEIAFAKFEGGRRWKRVLALLPSTKNRAKANRRKLADIRGPIGEFDFEVIFFTESCRSFLKQTRAVPCRSRFTRRQLPSADHPQIHLRYGCVSGYSQGCDTYRMCWIKRSRKLW